MSQTQQSDSADRSNTSSSVHLSKDRCATCSVSGIVRGLLALMDLADIAVVAVMERYPCLGLLLCEMASWEGPMRKGHSSAKSACEDLMMMQHLDTAPRRPPSLAKDELARPCARIRDDGERAAFSLWSRRLAGIRNHRMASAARARAGRDSFQKAGLADHVPDTKCAPHRLLSAKRA